MGSQMHINLVVRKPVLGICYIVHVPDRAQTKAKYTQLHRLFTLLNFLHEASLVSIISRERIKIALITLCMRSHVCAFVVGI